MRLDRFDLNLLVVLDALLEERNVTRASKRLHIGQSAASGALARLREYFNDDLLVVKGRVLILTPLAESLVDPVRKTLMHARSTIARKPGFDPATVERKILISASDYVTTVLLTQVIRKLALESPGVALDIRSPTHDVFERFERGNLDLLIMPEQFRHKIKAPCTKLFEDSHACLVWSENAVLARNPGAPFNLDTYMAMGHVSVHFGERRDTAFDDWFAPRYGQQRRVELSVDNFGVLPLVLIGTSRIATLHRKQAEHFAARYPLRLLPAPFDMPPILEYLFWPPHLDADPVLQWFRALLVQSALSVTSGVAPDLMRDADNKLELAPLIVL